METLRSFIVDCLEKDQWSTALAYASFEEAKIKMGFKGSQETYNRYVRCIKKEIMSDSSLEDDNSKENKSSFREEGNYATLEIDTERIKSINDLVKQCKVDLDVWNIEKSEINSWETAAKVNDELQTITLFRVKVYLSKKVPNVRSIPVVQPILIKASGNSYSLRSSETSSHIKRSLIINDAQIGYERDLESGKLNPFHDRKSLDVILQILSEHRFDEIVVNGDMLDFAEASTYPQKPEFAFTFQPAVNEFGWYLSELRRLAPQSKIVYLLGNHEKRLQKRITENLVFAYNLKAVDSDVPILSLRNILNLDILDIEFIEDYPAGKYWITDNLVVRHGEYTNLAKELTITTVNVIMGHLHKPEMLSKTIHDRKGARTITVACTPALCQNTGIVPGTTKPIWSTGFTYVDTNLDTLDSNIHHILTQDGICMYAGKVYKGKNYNFN